jgi:hypothetical protein
MFHKFLRKLHFLAQPAQALAQRKKQIQEFMKQFASHQPNRLAEVFHKLLGFIRQTNL